MKRDEDKDDSVCQTPPTTIRHCGWCISHEMMIDDVKNDLLAMPVKHNREKGNFQKGEGDIGV